MGGARLCAANAITGRRAVLLCDADSAYSSCRTPVSYTHLTLPTIYSV